MKDRLLSRALLVLALVIAVSLHCGCGSAATTAGVVHTAAVLTCRGARALANACEAAGLGPDEPCPVAQEMLTSGGEAQ